MKRFAAYLLFMGIAVISVMAADTYTVSSSSQLNVRKTPSQSGSVVGKMAPGASVNVESIEKGWARIEYNGKTGYVSAQYLSPGNAASASSSGLRPGPGQHIETTGPDDISRQFSTNRIMEHIPDFGFLRGKAGTPDVWFWVAFGLLTVCIGIKFFDEFDLSTDWCFYTTLVAFVGASICEIIYLLSSEEPLSFFSPDINPVFKAIASFILLVVMIMEQFNILVTLLVRIQDDAERGFMASYTSYFIWGGVIGLLGYFVTLFLHETTFWWWWPTCGFIVSIPVIAMLVSSFSRHGWKSGGIGIPLYIIGAIPIMIAVSVISIAVLFLLFVWFIISATAYFLGEGELRYDPYKGYYYAFPDGTTSLFNRYSY